MSVDLHLDDQTVKLLTWKPSVMRDIAGEIVRSFLRDRIAWSDEVDLSGVPPESANAIGLCWRQLTRAGIVEPMGQFQRSTRPEARGRRVFKYRLASEARALAFLRANGLVAGSFSKQRELALAG